MQDAQNATHENDAKQPSSRIEAEGTKEVLETIKEVDTIVKTKVEAKDEEPKPLDFAKKPETKTEKSGEINLGEDLKDDSDKKVKITFKKPDFLKQEVSKKTADAPIDDEPVIKTEPKSLDQAESVEEMREKIIAAENSEMSKMSVEDYEMMAEFVIDAMDWGGSSLLMYIAKDTTDTPYTLQEGKKAKLKKQLTRILVKNQTKMNFTALFFISLALTYSKPIKQALENRKAINRAEEERQKQIAAEKQRERQERIKEKQKEEQKVDLPKNEKKVEPVKVQEEAVKVKTEVVEEIKAATEVIKPTAETKVDPKTDKVVLDRGKGNPKGATVKTETTKPKNQRRGRNRAKSDS